MKTINYFILLSIFIFLSTCVKEVDNYTDVSYDKYVIEISQDYKFRTIKYYDPDSLVAQFIYQYPDNQVIITKKAPNNQIQLISVYYLKSNLADSCIDTFYFSNDTIIRKTEYQYDDLGYKTNASLYSKNIKDKKYTQDVNFNYVYSNGNAISVENNFGCSMEYRFSSFDNKLDIFTFKGNFCGRKDINLMNRSYSTCHGSSGTVPESSIYSYVFNESDLVVERTEIYTPSYHSGDEPEKEKIISHFEYKILN